MNPSNDDHRDLQQQLDEAERLCRAGHPGWQTLLERLPEQFPDDRPAADPARRARRRRLGPKTIVAAAGVLMATALGLWLLMGPDRPVGAEPPIEVERRGIRVTIFSETPDARQTVFVPYQGWSTARNQWLDANIALAMDNFALPPSYMVNLIDRSRRGVPASQLAMVEDRRMILHLKAGDNVVKFTDVAASIDPTSVGLTSDTDPDGFEVVQQDFEFDLIAADALLERSREQKIACIGVDEEEGRTVHEGYLLSYDDHSIELADRRPSEDPKAPRPKTQSISRAELQAVRLDVVPDDLATRPTLVWKLRARKPGNQLTTLRYLCRNVTWRADYVALVARSGAGRDILDLKGWVTLTNRSGTTLRDAELTLVAGELPRVLDPWAPKLGGPQDQEQMAQIVRQGAFPGGYGFPASGVGGFDRKTYPLDRTSTLKDRQIKQLGLMKAAGLTARRYYVCRAQERRDLHADVQLTVDNTKANHLGIALPKGRLTVMGVDGDGDHQLLGRDRIDHTPKDESVSVTIGKAVEVVYDFVVRNRERPSKRRLIETYEFAVRNHKSTKIQVRAIAELAVHQTVYVEHPDRDGRRRRTRELVEAKNWTMVESTDPYTMDDFKTLVFDFTLESNGEKTITYTVDYDW